MNVPGSNVVSVSLTDGPKEKRARCESGTTSAGATEYSCCFTL